VVRVVAAVQDPNPHVAGQGLGKLREAGIAVECGLMEAEARELNIGFFMRMTRGTPWVRSKIAASLDGRTALANGVSRWVTSEDARLDAHRFRARSCAVLTGIGTVLADDPLLNVRLPEAARQPLRVVADTALRTPPTARLFQMDGSVLIYGVRYDMDKAAALERVGAQVIDAAKLDASELDGRTDLAAILRDLAARGCNEVLVEAGSRLNGALLRAGLIDELILYLAPNLLGDAARGIAKLDELVSLDQRIELEWCDLRQVGVDLRIVARVKK
jgi:diaminohydroxyphosphoribosylaminopyrimidine deaminase/5-amino-6-(5-phosphoribosylamino)uracil reductase